MIKSSEALIVAKSIETQSRMVVASGSQGWGVVFNEFRVSVGEKSRDVMGNDGCKTMWMYLKPQNCTLKNG